MDPMGSDVRDWCCASKTLAEELAALRAQVGVRSARANLLSPDRNWRGDVIEGLPSNWRSGPTVTAATVNEARQYWRLHLETLTRLERKFKGDYAQFDKTTLESLDWRTFVDYVREAETWYRTEAYFFQLVEQDTFETLKFLVGRACSDLASASASKEARRSRIQRNSSTEEPATAATVEAARQWWLTTDTTFKKLQGDLGELDNPSVKSIYFGSRAWQRYEYLVNEAKEQWVAEEEFFKRSH